MSPTAFRSLLVASIVFGLLGGLIDDVIPTLLPQPAIEAQLGDLSTASLVILGIGVLALAVGGLVSLVGLFYFRAWARSISVIVTACSLAVWPLLGASMASGWSMALSELASTLWGVVLATAYFSPLSVRFTGVGANNSFKPSPLRGPA